MNIRTRWLLIMTSFAIIVGWSLSAVPATAAYPDKAIRFILPFPPGGGGDTSARIIAQRLSAVLGQPIVIDNRSGANGNIGTDLGAKARPDGYTIVFGTIGPIAVNVTLYSYLPYQPQRDFEPITLIADAVNALMLHASVPATTVKDYIALAKAQPGKLNYGSSGNGSAGHLAGELFNVMAGTNIMHIPHKGGGPLMVSLIGGQIPAVFGTLASGLPHIRSGKIRGVAVTSAARASMIPELPTVAEAGLAGYEASNWYGILAPAHTPRPIIMRLNQEIVKILQSQEVRDAFIAQGLLPQTTTPEEFRAYIRSEIAKWGKVIKHIGLQPD